MIVGIDPAYAKPHAIAIFKSGRLVEIFKSSGLSEIMYTLEGADKVYIEDQYLGQNAKTLKDLAHSTGKIMGLLEYTDTPYELIAPVTWQSYFKLYGKRAKEITNYRWGKLKEEMLINKAKELIGVEIEDCDSASAILIGLYGVNNGNS